MGAYKVLCKESCDEFIFNSRGEAYEFCSQVLCDPEKPTSVSHYPGNRIQFEQDSEMVCVMWRDYPPFHNDAAAIVKWFCEVLRKSTLSNPQKAMAVRRYYPQIVNGAEGRGDVSEGLVVHFGREKFSGRDLYL